MADQPRRFTASGYLGDGWQRIRRDDPESSSALRNGSGALVPTLSALDKIMTRFDQLEFKLDARDRRVDRLKATRLPKPDQPYFLDDGHVDGYRSQGDVWPTDEDGPPVFNHGRRVRCGDVRRRRGTGRDLNRREAGLAQPSSGTIPYRAHTASWPRTSWDRPAAHVTTEYQQPTSWDPPSTAPPIGILPMIIIMIRLLLMMMSSQRFRMSGDSDLLWDVVGVTDSSSSPSCVDNCSQHKCLDSDDDYEDDRVDGDERRSYNLTAAEFQLVRVLVQRFMEDKQFGGRRNDADVRSRCMIQSLLQVPAIEDDVVKTKAREERDDVEMLVGVIIGRRNVVSYNDGLVRSVGGEFERKRLASEGCEGLVRGAPVVAHADPPGLVLLPFTHMLAMSPPPPTFITYTNTPYPFPWNASRTPTLRTHVTLQGTYIPAEADGHNVGLPLGDLHEGRLGHVEVGVGRVAPIVVLGPIGRAEIGGGDGGDGRILIAILRFRAPHLEALPAPVPVDE
ncbi:hypothetical protein SASPL_109921 [Salvia splendens]|uniref:Uncharacterized protein n=1 Tax=Salvia splendens TaxID=180675 RepID=A0A8X8YKY2_SALSN|nr:hypothetical protein SASPL_109921 [Salvia splendens]